MFLLIPVIGWVAGPIFVLCALFMNLGAKKRTVWRCRNCRAARRLNEL
jgi:hypothetical protein